MQKYRLLSVLALIVCVMSACSMYRPQIQQGNVITPKMVSDIKPGMKKDQVKFLLGSPDVDDPWSDDTWYYVYTNKQQGLPSVINRLVLTFNHDKLSHISGNYPSPAPLRYKTYDAK